MVQIKTSHVGSLPRPKEVADLLFEIEAGTRKKDEAAEKIFDKAVMDVVAKQKSIGIDIPSDGEMSKISYATYISERISGFAGDSPRCPPADLSCFPGYLKKIAASGGTPTYKRPQCVETLGDYKIDFVNKDLERFKVALQKSNYETAFMNSASPGVIALFQPSCCYDSFESYLQDLAKTMRQEYSAIVQAGLYLQIDAPDLALGRHMMYNDLSDEEFLKKLKLHLDAISFALDGIDKSKVRLHICWGNYEGPHHLDIELEKLLPAVLELNIGALLVESANARHEHEWEVWQKFKIPEDLIIMPGMVDSTSNFIEHPNLIRQRIERFVNIFGRERVVAGTDCGFSTFAGFGAVDAEIAYKKLASLCQGASLFNQSKNSL